MGVATVDFKITEWITLPKTMLKRRGGSGKSANDIRPEASRASTFTNSGRLPIPEELEREEKTQKHQIKNGKVHFYVAKKGCVEGYHLLPHCNAKRFVSIARGCYFQTIGAVIRLVWLAGTWGVPELRSGPAETNRRSFWKRSRRDFFMRKI